MRVCEEQTALVALGNKGVLRNSRHQTGSEGVKTGRNRGSRVESSGTASAPKKIHRGYRESLTDFVQWTYRPLDVDRCDGFGKRGIFSKHQMRRSSTAGCAAVQVFLRNMLFEDRIKTFSAGTKYEGIARKLKEILVPAD